MQDEARWKMKKNEFLHRKYDSHLAGSNRQKKKIQNLDFQNDFKEESGNRTIASGASHIPIEHAIYHNEGGWDLFTWYLPENENLFICPLIHQ